MDSNNQNWESQYEFQKKYSSIECFFSKFHIGTILNNCGIRKTKGASPLTIMTSIFSLAFMGKNFFRGIVKNDEKPFGKDAAYDFLKSPVYNWRKVILTLGFQIFSFMNKLTSESRENVLIFDETPMDKSRSKKVELLANVYDHAQNKFIKGFRMLTVCWSDGSSLIPLDFAILSSRNEKNRIQGIEKKLDKRTCGYKRRLEALQKATSLLENMASRIQSYRIKFDYILMDSWFAWPEIISTLHSKAPVICMLKKTSKVHFRYGDRKMNVKSIYRCLPKRRGKARLLTYAFVTLPCGMLAKLVFIRDRKKKDWLVLLSTDIDLPDEEIVRIYGKRWNIEIFFKMAKQYLKLVKEIQARDFDSLISHTSIVFIRYQFLAYEQRIRTDGRTFGEMFYAAYEEMADISFLESLTRILTMAVEKLRNSFEFSEEIYQKLIDTIMGQAITFFNSSQNRCQRAL